MKFDKFKLKIDIFQIPTTEMKNWVSVSVLQEVGN